MGYMGFGMKKEVYTRKPKRAFEKVKEYIHSNEVYSSSLEMVDATEAQLQRARNQTRQAQWESDVKKLWILGISVLAGLIIVWGLVWWFIL